MGIPIGVEIELICRTLPVVPQGKCITLPGGVEICVQMPGIPRDLGELTKQLLAQMNAALTPLAPVFNIIDAVIAIFNTVKAIPDAIMKLDIGGLAEALKEMAEKIAALLKLIPQLSIPLMVIGLIDCIIAALEGLKIDLEIALAYQQQILEAGLLAVEPGNIGLVAVIDCATLDFEAYIENLNEGAQPLNRLIGLLNLFMNLIGLEGIPLIAGVEGDIQGTIDALGATIEVMSTIRDAIPLP